MAKKQADRRPKQQLLDEITELRSSLDEAEQTIEAIRSGQVDALVVAGPFGEQIFSLAGAERVYRVIVETMNEAALTVDFSGTILFCNQQFARLMCRPMEQVIGLNVTDFAARGQKSALSRILTQARTAPVKGRLVLQRQDGAVVHVQLSANPLEIGESQSICLVASDLTELEASVRSIAVLREQEQKLEAANEALAAAHRQIQSIIDNTPAIVYAFDLEERFIMVNAAIAELLNSTPQQMIGKRRHEFMPKEDADWHEAHDRQTIEAGRPLEFEEHSQLQGRSIAWLTTKFPLRDAQGRIYAVAGISTDISERKRAEEAMREHRALLMAVMDGTADPVYVKDRESRILMANEALAKVAGKPLDEIVGRTDSEYYGDAAVGQVLREHDRQVMACGQSLVVEETVPTPDGERIFLSAKAPYRAPSGEVIGTVGISHDITDRKMLEEELREATEELARSNVDLEQFAYVASHDLQEPLRTVSGFLKLLRDRCASQLDDKAREYIGFAVDGAHRMSQLINDLLTYSRVERKGRPIEPTDANTALACALAGLSASIEDTGVAVTHDKLPTVNADPTQLTQLFQNLIGNAIKFRKLDQPCRVHIGVQAEAGWWVFSVRDNGIGIDPAQHERLFAIFKRLHGQDEYPGTGIGLAICKKIVERHGGRIWVESKLGEGATFCFTMPRGDVA